MSRKDDKIASALGIEPFSKSLQKIEVDKEPYSNDPEYELIESEKDLEEVKSNYKSLMERGNEAIEELAQIAASSEDPKDYTALAKMIATVSGVNKNIETLVQEKIKEVKAKNAMGDEDSSVNHTTNNLNFYGTTAEFQKLVNSPRGDIDESE